MLGALFAYTCAIEIEDLVIIISQHSRVTVCPFTEAVALSLLGVYFSCGILRVRIKILHYSYRLF